jgi:copper(I)-binding protein
MVFEPLIVDVPTMYLLRWAALAFAMGLASEAMGGVLEVTQPWLREPAPGQTNAAIYFRLRNGGSQEVIVEGARVEGAAGAAIHEHRQVDGMMAMRATGPLAIAAGTTLGFAPGAYHLMVFGLQATPRAGERLHFCLRFGDGSEQCAEALVRAIGE